MNTTESKSELRENTQTLEIGIREKRELVFYPLSMADFMNMEDAIEEVMKLPFDDFFQKTPVAADTVSDDVQSDTAIKNINFGKKILGIIRKNAVTIFTMTTGEDGNEILREMSPSHFSQAVRIVLDMNYEKAKEAVGELVGMFTGILPKA